MSLDIFWNASPVIVIHTLCAFAALGLGTAMFLRKKGTKSHKMIGRTFALLMVFVAISAIFIRNINDGAFSLIHIFVIVTFTGLFQAFYHIRKGNLRKHKSAVKGLFFGALLIPGVLAFLPGRLLWMAVFT